jgi:hypothetical protein
MGVRVQHESSHTPPVESKTEVSGKYPEVGSSS